MKKNPFVLTVLCCLVFFPAIGQQLFTIKGSARDTLDAPVPTATIRLLRYKDSLLVKTGLSDRDGQFELTSGFNDSLMLTIEAVGYRFYSRPIFTGKKDSIIRIPNIVLHKKE